VGSLSVDGQAVDGRTILLCDDHREHQVELWVE
jgi:hypothetical protein